MNDQGLANKIGLDAISWLDQVLTSAIKERASDIHFEPHSDKYSIRYRIDGILQTRGDFPKFVQDNYISRIKVLAKMDIMEKRFPQDGRFEINLEGKTFNIRVSSLPTLHGEAIACRILNREDMLINMNTLGFDKEQFELASSLIKRSSGIVLATGPTGSGKTSLLYAIIREVDKPDNNIISIEDPVEYQMPTVRQVPINEGIGLTFPRVMRSIVRQDPDIIMVGEIRDTETAQMAINAAMTGCFLLSSMHTFTFPALITRLTDMSITHSILAQTLKGSISTRLLRKICPHCIQDYQPTDEEKKYLSDVLSVATFKKGKGCEACKNTGYLGRTGIFEVVYVDHEIRSSIVEKKSYVDFNRIFKEKKIKNLKEAAAEKVAQGVTTFEEAVRVIGLMPFITGVV